MRRLFQPGAARVLSAALAALALAGCAIGPPAPAPWPTAAPAWSAPLPPAHDGSRADLARWWSQFDDPLLAQLVESTQRANGDLAQAAARIDAARAQARAAGARTRPTLDATAAATRAQVELPPPAMLATSYGVGLDLMWEIDVFGVTRNAAAAAQARAAAAGAEWHDLRVTLAAETAARYVDLRACEALVAVYADDVRSQRRTAELTRIKAEAGLESPANAALASASGADASNRLIGQQADCDMLVKTLVALTAIAEPELRERLAARPARLPQPAQFAVQALPANLLMQRPDLRALEYQVQAAARDLGAAQADRYPRLSLAGALTLAGARAGGADLAGNNWSIGPAVVLPVFDAGRRAAQAEAAAAREREARERFAQRAREAVREVEQSLVRLDAASRREADARIAAEGFRQFFEAAQARFDAGVESVLDLESARRNALAAAAALVGVQRERVAAWVTLYRAVGGGWTDEDRGPATAAARAAQVSSAGNR